MMFTPQRKPWSGLVLTPSREQNGSATDSGSIPGNSNPRNGETTVVGKEKGLLFIESTPGNLGAEKHADLDKDAVFDKLSKLENEVSISNQIYLFFVFHIWVIVIYFGFL